MMLMLLIKKDQLLFTSVAGECTYTAPICQSVMCVCVCVCVCGCVLKLHPCAVFCRPDFNGVCKKAYIYCS